MGRGSDLKILIVKLGSIGDVIHAMPAVAKLRRALPDAQIDWLVERYAADVLGHARHVNRVIQIDTLRWRKTYSKPSTWREIRDALAGLRETRYDAVLELQGLWKSAFVAWLSRPRQLIGWNRRFLREPLSSLFYSQRLDREPRRENVVFEHLRMVTAFLESVPEADGHFTSPVTQDEKIEFDELCSSAERRWVEDELAALPAKEFVILNPGANWKSKLWPAQNYALLARRIHEEWGCPVLITAGPAEEILSYQVMGYLPEVPVHVVTPTIPQLAALAERARLFIGPDTGPLHIASACRTPIVGIFASTDPVRNGPVGPEDLVVQHNRCGEFCYRRDCGFRRCISMISVDEVFEAACARIQRVPSIQ